MIDASNPSGAVSTQFGDAFTEQGKGGLNQQMMLEDEMNFISSGVGGNLNPLDALPDDQTIYWRVRAIDSFNLLTWANDDSSGWSFTVDVPDPPAPFNLLLPEYGDTIWVSEVDLFWNETTDPDPYDIPLYDVWVDFDPGLITAWLEAEGLEDTTLLLIDLDDDTDYYWTVYATDSNTPGTWAEDTLMFTTYFPEPLQPFSLLLPANGAVLLPGPNTFTWETADDPDPGDIVDYTIWFVSGGDSVGYSALNDTTIDINPDTVAVLAGGGEAEWYVIAHSSYPEMTLQSNERFTLTLTIEPIIDLVISVEVDNIVLTWTAPAGTQGNYRIYRDTVPYFDITVAQWVFTYTGPTSGEVSWIDEGALNASEMYFYIVTHEMLPITAGEQPPKTIQTEDNKGMVE